MARDDPHPSPDAGRPRRRRLPDRRPSETHTLRHRHEDGRVTAFQVTIGYAPDDPMRPLELFYDAGFRSGADLEFLVQDAAVLMSLLLQHGVAPETLARSLSSTGDGAPGSLIGTLVAALGTSPGWPDSLPCPGEEG